MGSGGRIAFDQLNRCRWARSPKNGRKPCRTGLDANSPRRRGSYSIRKDTESPSGDALLFQWADQCASNIPAEWKRCANSSAALQERARQAPFAVFFSRSFDYTCPLVGHQARGLPRLSNPGTASHIRVEMPTAARICDEQAPSGGNTAPAARRSRRGHAGVVVCWFRMHRFDPRALRVVPR